jgi:hypothetical protein
MPMPHPTAENFLKAEDTDDDKKAAVLRHIASCDDCLSNSLPAIWSTARAAIVGIGTIATVTSTDNPAASDPPKDQTESKESDSPPPQDEDQKESAKDEQPEQPVSNPKPQPSLWTRTLSFLAEVSDGFIEGWKWILRKKS